MDTARAVGRRSLCSRDQVGAVIVTAENRIIDTGYNGPPAGWKAFDGNVIVTDERCVSWCPRARRIAEFEPDPKCSSPFAIHPPHDLCPGIPRLVSGLAADYSDCPSLHAEANALMFGDRDSRVGGSIYVSSTVCMSCAKLIANSGLRNVFFVRPNINDVHRNPQRSIDFMIQCGLEVAEIL